MAQPKSGGKTGLIIAAVVVVLVVLCGGGSFGVWALVNSQSDKPQAAPSSAASESADPEATDEPEPSDSPATDDDDASSGAGTDFAKGDCVVNEGTDDDAELKKVPCGPNTYEVLSTIPFTTDDKKCDTDPIFGSKETTTTYIHDSSKDFLDYVLCLKKR